MFKMTEQMADLVRLQRTWMKNKDLAAVQKGYYESCFADYKDIITSCWFGREPLHVLDIGCGMAGVDVLLYRFLCSMFPTYKTMDVRYHLLDKNRVDADVNYGYKTSEKASAYCDFKAAKAFAGLNGVPRGVFFFTETFPDQPYQFDLIFSLISCGFHYPIQAYLMQILDTLATDGQLVVDIRKHSGQFEDLHAVFDRVDVVRVEEKYKRVACWNE